MSSSSPSCTARSIGRTAKERLKAGKHALKLSFSAKRWPTGLSFKTKELTKPKPVPATGCENDPPRGRRTARAGCRRHRLRSGLDQLPGHGPNAVATSVRR